VARSSWAVNASVGEPASSRAARASAAGVQIQTQACPWWVGNTPASALSETISSIPGQGSPAK
jgi:hypothetical protein